MDFSSLIGSALQQGAGLVANVAGGNTGGLGAGVGSAAGGLLGTAFGGPVGTVVGSMAGKALGTGIQNFAETGDALKTKVSGGGGGVVPYTTAGGLPLALPVIHEGNAALVPPEVHALVQDTLKKAGSPPEQQKRAAALAKLSIVPPIKTVLKKADVPKAVALADTVAKTTAARIQLSNAIGQIIAAKPGGAEALKKAGGFAPHLQIPPGHVVRCMGLDELGKKAGLGGAEGLMDILGLSPAVVVATGLHKSAARHESDSVRLARQVRHLLGTVNAHEVRAQLSGMNAQLEGLVEGPLSEPYPPDPGRAPPSAGQIPQGVTPGAVPVRGENWDFDSGHYALAWGDTLTGLAKTYLGTGARWRDIWDAQDSDFRFSHSPDKLIAGTVLVMPPEAVKNAQTLLSNPGAKVTPLGKVQDPKGNILSSLSTGAKVGIGLGVTGLVGGLGYLAWKHRGR